MLRKATALLLLGTGQLFAWNSMGHQLIAQIALDNLPPGYVKKLAKLNHEMDAVYPPRRLAQSASWMDEIRFHQNQWFTHYHYDDRYFSDDKTPLPHQRGKHAVWAIRTAIKTLESPQTTPFNKAFSLRLLLHVVGDIHQPLHTIARVTKQHPFGDQGGNDYSISSPYGNSLHAFWDNGGGYLLNRNRHKYKQVLKTAKYIEQRYPCAGLAVNQVNLNAWLKESREKAVRYIYLPLHGKHRVVTGYTKKAQQLSEKQIALAGCRLAKLLEDINISYT